MKDDPTRELMDPANGWETGGLSPGDRKERLLTLLAEEGPERHSLYELAILYETELLDYNGALHCYGQILQQHPEEIRAWLGRGLICYLLCNDTGALEAFLKVIELNPGFSATAWLYSAKLLQPTDPLRALEHLEQADRMLGREGVPEALRGEILWQKGDLKGALAEFQNLFQLTESPWFGIKCASLKNILGDFTGALADLDRSRPLEGLSPAYHMELALAWKGQNHFAEALQEIQRAVAIRPDFQPAQELSTRLEEEAAKFSKIREVAPSESVKIQPPTLTLEERLEKGRALISGGKTNEALQILEGVDPGDDPESLTLLADLTYRIQDFEKSLEIYRSLCRMHPEDPQMHFHCGICLDRLERYEESLSCYERSLELNPHFGAAWLNRGYALYRLKNFSAAIESTTEAIKCKEDFAGAWYNRGCFFALLGESNRAIEDLRQSVLLNPIYSGRARKDPDLVSLLENPEFRKLIELPLS